MTASGTAPTPYLRRVRLARKNSASPVSACNRSTKRASVSGLSKSRAPIIRIPMVSSPSNFTSPSAVLIVVTAAVRRCPARSRRGPNPIDAFFSMTGDGFGFAVEQCFDGSRSGRP